MTEEPQTCENSSSNYFEFDHLNIAYIYLNGRLENSHRQFSTPVMQFGSLLSCWVHSKLASDTKYDQQSMKKKHVTKTNPTIHPPVAVSC